MGPIAGRALAMGDRRQRVRGSDVDRRVLSVLLDLTSFANYNATYGSLGAVVGLMIWLWISTVVVLLGPSSTPRSNIRRLAIPRSAKKSPWARGGR